MQIGLLGKANVGKSTFFSAATETPVQIGNFPFTTIQPNVGIAYVNTTCACKHFKIEHKNAICVSGINGFLTVLHSKRTITKGLVLSDIHKTPVLLCTLSIAAYLE